MTLIEEEPIAYDGFNRHGIITGDAEMIIGTPSKWRCRTIGPYRDVEFVENRYAALQWLAEHGCTVVSPRGIKK